MNNHNPLPPKQKPVVSPRIPFNDTNACFETDIERIARFKHHTRNLVIKYVFFTAVFCLSIGVLIGLYFGVQVPRNKDEVLTKQDVTTCQLELQSERDNYKILLNSHIDGSRALSKIN